MRTCECGQLCHDSARSCPRCGNLFTNREVVLAIIVAAIFAAGFAFMYLAAWLSNGR